MKTIILFACALIISGCSTGRSYHDANNPWKLGYSDTQLNENVYRVSYAGYDIPQNECDDFAIFRAAEISKARGYKYFRILDEKQSSSSQTYYIPGATHTTGTVTSYGNVATVNATNVTNAAVVSGNYPVSTITIELLREKGDASNVLDAEIIRNSLIQKLGIEK